MLNEVKFSKRISKTAMLVILIISIILNITACGNESTKKKKKKVVVVVQNNSSDNTSLDNGDLSDDTMIDDNSDGFYNQQEDNILSDNSDYEGVSTNDSINGSTDSSNNLDETDADEREPRKMSNEEIPDASAPIKNILYVKDFGAKGDGVTDDGKAIFDAMMALWAAGDNSKLVFESNKTYYYKDNGTGSFYTTVIQLEDCVNVHIEGKNTNIVLEAPLRMVRTNGTVGCSIKGINFDYGKRPYFMASNATEIDTKAGTCVMEVGKGMAEAYLGLTEIGQTVSVPVNGNEGNPFGVIESEWGRYHMWLNQYELVGKDKIKIYFMPSVNTNVTHWMPKLATERLICPTPNVGHMVEHAFHFEKDRDLTIKDVTIYSSCKYTVGVSNGEGVFTFDNFNIMPNPALKGTNEETDFSAWRDGWHLKENRAKVIWRNCTARGLQDDIFNISSSVMWVKEVQAANRINMHWDETGGPFRANLKKGDTMTFLNADTGETLASTTVSRVVKQSGSDNIVVMSDSFANMPTGENIKVVFDSLVAPGSSIDNCWFDGTYRFRGPITITNTTFVTKRLWLDILVDNWLEAPVPRDILFKNCKILFENGTGKYVHASAYNNNLSKNAYHIKNLVFENCVVDSDCFEIGMGDEVIFKNCTDPNP